MDRRQCLTLAALGGLGLLKRSRADDTPTVSTGLQIAELKPFDQLMEGFVRDNQVPGASLAISRHGQLIYARGFGYANTEQKVPVSPESLFRIASVSKPLTAVAVMQLVEQGKVKLDSPVMDYFQLEPATANGKIQDDRWKRVTVRHCLQHTGGWDRSASYDPIALPQRIADSLKIDTPVPPEAIIRYMLGQPLDFDPGEKFAYSNLGYLLLGRVIETATEQPYEAYVRKSVLAPLGIRDMRLGRALPEDRAKNEVAYYDSKGRTRKCLYPPRLGEEVPLPDGGENLEGYEAHGGWIASTIDLVRFVSAFDQLPSCRLLKADTIRQMWERPKGTAGWDDNGKPKATYFGCGWSVRPIGKGDKVNAWHGGLIAGTSALMVRRHDGLDWAVLFNTDANADGQILGPKIDPLLHQAAAEVREWPILDLFQSYGYRD